MRTNDEGIHDSVSSSKYILDYNAYMGGVDKLYQLFSIYNISWKSRRWWFKIFYYMVDCIIVNSYICNYSGRPEKNLNICPN